MTGLAQLRKFLTISHFRPDSRPEKEVQLDLTPEIEVFHMLSESCHAKKNQTVYKILQFPELSPVGPPCISHYEAYGILRLEPRQRASKRPQTRVVRRARFRVKCSSFRLGGKCFRTILLLCDDYHKISIRYTVHLQQRDNSPLSQTRNKIMRL